MLTASVAIKLQLALPPSHKCFIIFWGGNAGIKANFLPFPLTHLLQTGYKMKWQSSTALLLVLKTPAQMMWTDICGTRCLTSAVMFWLWGPVTGYRDSAWPCWWHRSASLPLYPPVPDASGAEQWARTGLPCSRQKSQNSTAVMRPLGSVCRPNAQRHRRLQ